jgi:6-phosphogluconate dehydrogenase
VELGIIGLGKMGFNMAERLRLAGHKVVGFDFNKDATAKLTANGSIGVNTLEDLVKSLSAPRAVWIMVPSGDPVDQTIARLEPLMAKGDTFIDGGNSNYKDTQRRHAEATAKGFHYVDCGTSGGVWGLKEGYSMMIGGDKEPVGRLTPIFEALAPSKTEGWGHVGPAGAGHFVKMVHNGIEYGMMQSYAEGFSIMKAKTPLNLDLTQISQIWQKGSVVRSWLLDLTADCAEEEPHARRA